MVATSKNEKKSISKYTYFILCHATSKIDTYFTQKIANSKSDTQWTSEIATSENEWASENC